MTTPHELPSWEWVRFPPPLPFPHAGSRGSRVSLSGYWRGSKWAQDGSKLGSPDGVLIWRCLYTHDQSRADVPCTYPRGISIGSSPCLHRHARTARRRMGCSLGCGTTPGPSASRNPGQGTGAPGAALGLCIAGRATCALDVRERYARIQMHKSPDKFASALEMAGTPSSPETPSVLSQPTRPPGSPPEFPCRLPSCRRVQARSSPPVGYRRVGA